MTDKITVIRTLGGLRMTKTWRADGTIGDYDTARRFTTEQLPVDSVHALAAVLEGLQNDPHACVIRGTYPPDHPKHVIRRLDATTDDPHHWFLVDIDKFTPVIADPVLDPVAAIEEYLEAHLPILLDTSFYWQLSSSAGHPKNRDILKAHVWFFGEHAFTSDEMEAWARTTNGAVDVVGMRQVQPLYTASPVFDEGALDPVPHRSGFYQGCLFDTAQLVIDPQHIKVAKERRRSDRHSLVDPTQKGGLIGAFCRAYPPDRVINEILPEHFVFAEGSEHRITWLTGNGAPEGLAISDDGHHIFSSHNTDPFAGHAVNMFDFVKHYKFGHEDDGADELDLLDETRTPSQQAMMAWVKTLPDVQEEKAEHAEQQLTAPLPTLTAEQQEKVDRFDRAARLVETAALEATLIDTVIPRLRDAKFDDVEREKLVVAVRQKLKAFGTSMPLPAVRKMLRPLPPAFFKHLNQDGVPLLTQENISLIMDKIDASVRYNLIRRRLDIDIPGIKTLHDTKNSALLTRLMSSCVENGLSAHTQLLKAYIQAHGSENAYNPVMDWIDSEEWDGKDRLEALYATVVVEPGKEEYRNLVLRKWLLSAVAIANNNDGQTMARGVLVFQGPQYMGKTKWLRSLVPSDQDWVHTGAALKAGDRDSEKKLTSFWLVELGELGSTFNRSDADAFKAFISQTDDVMRLPYAAAEDEFRRRTAYFASVNDALFLRDATGETRFWVLAVQEVRPDHGIDVQQLWAQVAALWRAGERHWLEPSEMAEVEASNQDFKEADPIAELVGERLRWDGSGEAVWESATGVARRLHLINPNKGQVNAVAANLRKRGAERKRSDNGGWLYRVFVDDVL